MKIEQQHNIKKVNLTLKSKSKEGNRLESMAEQLNLLANQKLRNGCLGGCIHGYEDEIRQDAILLALRWYARGRSESGAASHQIPSWNPAKAIAHALNFTKRRHARNQWKDAIVSSKAHPPATITCVHPACLGEGEIPTPQRQAMVRKGIALAVRQKLITRSNACISELVLCDGESANEVAARLNCHRSAVYQHLHRTRAALRNVISHIEIPFIS